MNRAITQVTTAAAISAAAEQHQAVGGQREAADDRRDPGDQLGCADRLPAAHGLLGRLPVPAHPLDVLLELGVERGDVLAELEQVVGIHDPLAVLLVGEVPEPVERVALGRTDRLAPIEVDPGVGEIGLADLDLQPVARESPDLGLERDLVAAREVEHRGRQGVPR